MSSQALGIEGPSRQVPGDVSIQSVNITPTDPQPGDLVEITVSVQENSLQVGNFVDVFGIVVSPSLNSPVVWYCVAIEEGTTAILEGGCSTCGATSTFTMPEGITLHVIVGGMTEGNHCTTQDETGFITDTRTIRLGEPAPKTAVWKTLGAAGLGGVLGAALR